MEIKVKSFSELTAAEVYEILKARASVFVVELGMNCLDPDGTDYNALHIFLTEDNKILAYFRAFFENNTVKIGRVLTINHGVGHGKELFKRAIPEIKRRFCFEKIVLDSQKTAVEFYEKLGFKAVSDEFLEEGIPHIKMELV